MSGPVEDRRRHRRHRPDPATLRVRFSFPDERGARHEAALNDVSVAGVSFLLEKGHPAFETGDALKSVEVDVLGTRLHGEIVVMHAARNDDGSGHCGGLFFPATDEDLLTLRRICDRLETAAAPEGS